MGIEQINQAIMQMDSVTQQNAALVEQSAAAAESLQGQALTLAALVGQFVVAAPNQASVAAPTGQANFMTTPARSQPGLALIAARPRVHG